MAFSRPKSRYEEMREGACLSRLPDDYSLRAVSTQVFSRLARCKRCRWPKRPFERAPLVVGLFGHAENFFQCGNAPEGLLDTIVV
jgi:hypothetical protein